MTVAVTADSTCLTSESHSLNTQETNHRWDFYFALLVAGIILFRGLLITQYGINREAGGEFDAVFQILEGKLIYRDFYWYHGFLPLYWNALLFKIFGPQMYLMRANVVLFAALGGFFAYKICRLFISPPLAVIASLLSFSGLVTPLHVTGQSIVISIEIVSFYFLLEYLNSGRFRCLFWSGLFCGIILLIQIFPVGVVTLSGVGIAITCFFLFDSKSHIPGLKYFLLGFFPLPLICYGLLATIVPSAELYNNLFPMFSGYEVQPGKYGSFPIPSIYPVLYPIQSMGQFIAVLNKYLFVNFRWWLIILVFVWGLVEFFIVWKNDRLEKKRLLLLGTLVLFCPIFESKFLIFTGRLGLTPSVINMLPTYILLLYLVSLRSKLKSVALVLGVGMLTVYFAYPFGRYYWYFVKNAVPLDMPYSSGIKVSPYNKDLYKGVHEYVTHNSRREELIVVAEINRYYSVFSGRTDLFRRNFQTFLQVSFYPSRWVTGQVDKSYPIEEKIVEEIKSANVKLILIPEGFRTDGDSHKSPFLKFLNDHWEKIAVFGDLSLKNPFDWESPMEIYQQKQTPVFADEDQGWQTNTYPSRTTGAT